MAGIAVQTLPTVERGLMENRNQRPIRLQKPLAQIANDLLETTAEISRQVVDDIIQWASGGDGHPRNDPTKTMRRLVTEVLDKHSSLFRGLVTRLDASHGDLSISLWRLADAEFEDGEASWGRIVSLCAFVARLSQHYRVVGFGDRSEELGAFLRSYFNENLNAWIASQGGWDQFTNRFRVDSTLESKIFKGLLATGLAFGVIAGLVALR